MTSTSQPKKIFLEHYSGQTLEELIALAPTHRLDSLVLAMEQALEQREVREGSAALTREERIVLAIEAFEREVNNGGFGQFFTNSSNEYAAGIEADLRAIGCLQVASIASQALKALKIRGAVTPQSIEQAVEAGGESLEEHLAACDSEFFALGEDLAPRLFAFVQKNAAKVRLR